MGVTIHYRGTLDAIDRIEELEDRVTDLVHGLGGRATIWRSYADHDRSRVIRGLMIEMAPGQDTLSLLVSPEGHLTPLFQIEEAEKTPFDEPPYCFVKTQFGSLEGHIAIVHLLDALRKNFCSNLLVSDEGGYYEDRDVGKLTKKMQFLGDAIESLADGLRKHGLSEEAAEDPNILASRIQRVAMLVQKKMSCDLVTSDASIAESQNPEWNEPSLEDEVERMDAGRRKNDIRGERMSRRIAEATASGMKIEEAFELAMQQEGFDAPSCDAESADESADEEPTLEDSAVREPWKASLPDHPFDESSEFGRQDHPAVLAAQQFLLCVMGLEETEESEPSRDSFAAIASRGAMDIVGGLVQATSLDFDSRIDRALAITQLKRSLHGHAFARGAIFGLRSEDRITQTQSNQLHDQLDAILETIHALSEQAWSES